MANGENGAARPAGMDVVTETLNGLAQAALPLLMLKLQQSAGTVDGFERDFPMRGPQGDVTAKVSIVVTVSAAPRIVVPVIRPAEH